MRSGARRSNRISSARIDLGQHIVSDPAVCHGRVTFKGSRIFVSDVLADVEQGLSWDFIIRRWGAGKLTKAAITEAVQLARNAWLDENGRLSCQPSEGRAVRAA
jgi:uncharacterized protein (DUF433 family)